MMKIKTLEVLLEFVDDISFIEETELAFFKIIYKRLKKIVCLNLMKDCSICSYTPKCVYYYLSGKDFMYLTSLPVILKRPLISKKVFKPGDELYLKIIFLGRSIIHINFFTFILKELELKGLFKENKKFIIRSQKSYSEELELINKKINGLRITSPIDIKKDLFKYEFLKLKQLNEEHNIVDFSIEYKDINYTSYLKDFRVRNSIIIGANKIKYKGKVGILKFDYETELDNFFNLLSFIGLGRFYGIGGGNFEFISSNVS